jgi:hypothetical protein
MSEFAKMRVDFPISIAVKLTASEVYWASAVVTVRQLRKLLWIWGSITTLFALMALITWLRPRAEADWHQMLQNGKPLMWFLLFPFFLVFVTPLIAVRQFFKDGRNAQGTQFQFGEGGVKILTSVGNADLNWTAFLRGQETKSCFLLFTTTSLARVIPKRCAASSEEIRSLRELFGRNIPQFRSRPD